MIKKLIIAVVFLTSPAFAFAQNPATDLFLSFGQGTDASNTSETATTADGIGTAFLFARNGFDFDALDVEVFSTDSSVASITGGTIANTTFTSPPLGTFSRFNQETTVEILDDGSLRLFGVPISNGTNTIGVSSAASTIDPDFDEDADAFLLGVINFDILSEGTVDFSVRSGTNGILIINQGTVDTVLRDSDFSTSSAGLIVVQAVPEPSATALLVIGMAGMLVRRKR